VLVHYRTPALAAEAVAALRRELAADSLDAELILVDNGNDDAGKRRLAALPVRYVDAGENLGYAGGVNLGVAQTSAEWLMVMNPDVLVLPGCLRALLGALRDGYAVAGPRFYWDSGRRLLLPPTEPRRRRDEIWAALAQRGGGLARLARRRFRAHARRHWRAIAPLRSASLAGSLLAFHRSVWERVGPFDASFRLYFEETEWLRRVVEAGMRPGYVPAAEAVHLYARSAEQQAEAPAWFAESARRFRLARYGRRFSRALEALARRPPPVPGVGHRRPCRGALPLGGPGRALWIEVSPNPAGFPAAGERLESGDGEWRLPGEVEERVGGATLFAQVCDERGRELGRYRLGGGAID
jgi:hypothetical protein